MVCYYIKQSSETNKLKNFINYIFNIIKLKDNTIILPKHNIGNRKAKRIVKQLKEKNVRFAIIAENLNQFKNLKNEALSNDIEFLDGKYLYRVILDIILEYICLKQNKKMENIDVLIMVNDICEINKNVIIELAEKVKSLTLVTNSLNEARNIDNYLYNEKGIVISILKSNINTIKNKIIINIDFCQEDINRFNIPIDGIIINVLNEIKIKIKKFNGININGYNIIIPCKYKNPEFNSNLLYESYIFNMQFNKAKERVLNDKIKIKNLLGEKGIIQNEEFIK